MEKADMILNYLEKQFTLVPHLISQQTNSNTLKTRYSFLRLKKLVVSFINGHNTSDRFIVLPGLRGVGKTTLLYQIFNMVLSHGLCKRENLLYLSCDALIKQGFELEEVMEVYEDKILSTSFEELEDKTIILIDEAHYCKSWSNLVKVLYDRCKNVLIFVSGSSSLPLELSTDAVRRANIERIYPLGFLEYLTLKYDRFYPPKGFKEDLREAIFNSKNAKEVFNKIKPLTNKIRKEIILKVSNFHKEFESFIVTGGFPFTLTQTDDTYIFQRIINIVEKIIYQDFLTYSSLTKDTLNKVFPILNILSGTVSPVSFGSIEKAVGGIKKTQIFEIMTNLTKTGVIGNIQICGSITKAERNSKKYLFNTPAIRSSLLWNQGKFSKSSTVFGSLLEDSVFNTLMREKIFSKRVLNITYPESQMADFLINTTNQKLAIECGWSKKETKGLKKVIEKEKCDFGIVISSEGEKLLEKENIVYIPKEVFLLL